MYKEDTIAAISTPIGIGGIGVIRVSGKKAIKIADEVFTAKNKQHLTQVSSHTVHFGYIVRKDKENSFSKTEKDKNEIIDEVLVAIMRAPHSYTGEDVVEISCHGGIVPLRRVISLIFEKGAQPASPGEFTKRAFLNGRVDLTQAEAIYDIINAKTETSLQIAVQQLHGNLSIKLNEISDEIVDILASLEAALDYPEEDVSDLSKEELVNKIEGVSFLVNELLKTAHSGMIIREGLRVVITGKPNVGKSSLLNALVQNDKAIVTSIPGTTRDIIEEWMNVEGLPLKIFDTAGVKKTKDKIEQLGIQRSKKALEEADIILFVIDLSSPLTQEDEEITNIVANKTYMVVGNKSDLSQVVNEKNIKQLFYKNNLEIKSDFLFVKTSALQKKGIEQLKDLIYKLFIHGSKPPCSESILVTNVRHTEVLRRANESLEEAKKTCKNGSFYELMAMDLRAALNILGEITGKVTNENILDQIFSKFCIGK